MLGRNLEKLDHIEACDDSFVTADGRVRVRLLAFSKDRECRAFRWGGTRGNVCSDRPTGIRRVRCKCRGAVKQLIHDAVDKEARPSAEYGFAIYTVLTDASGSPLHASRMPLTSAGGTPAYSYVAATTGAKFAAIQRAARSIPYVSMKSAHTTYVCASMSLLVSESISENVTE